VIYQRSSQTDYIKSEFIWFLMWQILKSTKGPGLGCMEPDITSSRNDIIANLYRDTEQWLKSNISCEDINRSDNSGYGVAIYVAD
jgi:hypothetical protein